VKSIWEIWDKLAILEFDPSTITNSEWIIVKSIDVPIGASFANGKPPPCFLLHHNLTGSNCRDWSTRGSLSKNPATILGGRVVF
jgi:hypothetical protein